MHALWPSRCCCASKKGLVLLRPSLIAIHPLREGSLDRLGPVAILAELSKGCEGPSDLLDLGLAIVRLIDVLTFRESVLYGHRKVTS